MTIQLLQYIEYGLVWLLFALVALLVYGYIMGRRR